MHQISKKKYDGFVFIIFISVVCFLLETYILNNERIELRLSHTEQNSHTAAVQIIQNKNRQGIYFFPEDSTSISILHALSIESPKGGEGVLYDKIYNGISIDLTKDRVVNLGSINAACKKVLGIPININEAKIEDLNQLPGIGERQAEQIISIRNEIGRFENIEDLMLVSGVKEKKLSQLRRYISLK